MFRPLLTAILVALVLRATPVDAQDLSNGLMGHWPLDQTLADASGRGHDAQLVGGLSWAPGRDGSANGSVAGFTTSSYLVVPHHDDLMPHAAYSAGGWFRFDQPNFAGNQTLFSKSEGIDYAVRITNGTLYISGASTSISSFSGGSWHHVMVTYNGSTLAIWINGSVVGSESMSGVLGGFDKPLSLGIELSEWDGSPYDPFLGAIDDFRFYDRALSTAEVQMLAGFNVNQAPVADFTATPTTGSAPLNVSLDGRTSSDPNGDVLQYAWDFGDGSTATGALATHRYTTEGSFPVTLTVTDPAGLSDTAQGSVIVTANVPPVASFQHFAQNSQRPWMVYFDASASSDTPDDGIVSYAWDFGDGETGTGRTITHTFRNVAGPTGVTLTVTDQLGTTGSLTRSLDVPNRQPSAAFTATPMTGMEPLEVSFDASTSTDVDGDALDYAWNFNDGTTGSGRTITHTFAAMGSYSVRLQVTDPYGATHGVNRTIEVTRFNTAPIVVVSADPTSGQPPLTVAFDASGTTDAEGDALDFAWDFGDGETGTGATISHLYNAAGIVVATVTVTDALGMSATGSVSVSLDVPGGTAISAAGGGPWSSPASWVGAAVPAADQQVLIGSAITGAGASAGVTVQAGASWTLPSGASVPGSVANHGSIIISGGTLEVAEHLANSGLIQGTVHVTGNLVNQPTGAGEGTATVSGTFDNAGAWTGSADVYGSWTNAGTFTSGSAGSTARGDLDNTGTYSGPLFVASRLTNAGTVNAGGSDVEVGAELRNHGPFSAGTLKLSPSGTLRLGHAPEFPPEARIVVSPAPAGKATADPVIVATSDLEIRFPLELGGSTLRTGEYGLRFARTAYARNGRVEHSGSVWFGDYLGRDLALAGDLVVTGNHDFGPEVRLEGTITIADTLSARAADRTRNLRITGAMEVDGVLSMPDQGLVLVDGDIINRGTISSPYAQVSGSIVNHGRWVYRLGGASPLFGSVLTLTGSGARTIRFTHRVYLQAAAQAAIRFVGDNVFPGLTGCNQAATTCEIAQGATVQVVHDPAVTDTRMDAAVVNNGTVLTQRIYPVNIGGSISGKGATYRVEARIPALARIDSIAVTDRGRVPETLASAVRAWWHVRVFPEDGSARRFENLSFTLADEVLNGNTLQSLVLFHSEDDGVTWKSVSSPANTTIGAGVLHFRDVPAGGDYALSADTDSPSVVRTMAISLMGDNIRVGGPRLRSVFQVRYTNTSPVPLDDALLVIQLEGGMHIHGIQPSDPDGGWVASSDDIIPIDSLRTTDDDQTAILAVRPMAPGESRVFWIWAWADRSSGKGAVAPLVKIVAIPLVKYFFDVGKDMAEGFFQQTFDCGAIEYIFWVPLDSMNRVMDRWINGEVPAKDVAKDYVKTVAELAEIPTLPDTEIMEEAGKMLGGVRKSADEYVQGKVTRQLDCGWYRERYLDPSWYWKEIVFLFSWDPNDKLGPAGVGEEGFVSSAGRLDYVIRFENKDEATAPAYYISIVDTLDASIDPSTVRFDGASHDLFTMTRTGNVLLFEAEGIDLPPNVNPPEGEGFVAFSADPYPGLPSGTRLENTATITFDVNDPIRTNTVVNTYDFVAPRTLMEPLADHVLGDSVTVRWSTDDFGTSGVEATALFRSVDGGPYEQVGSSGIDSLRVATPPGHTYAFYALSRDRVGNTERTRPTPVQVLVTGVGTEPVDGPVAFALEQNYPNPFNPRTTIRYATPAPGDGRIDVFDALGRRVATLVDGPIAAGRHVVTWDASGVASGLYFCRFVQGRRTQTRAMILLR